MTGDTTGIEILGIRECTRCGDTGDQDEEFGVEGVARIGGNLCIDCVRGISEKTDKERENDE